MYAQCMGSLYGALLLKRLVYTFSVMCLLYMKANNPINSIFFSLVVGSGGSGVCV